MKKAVVAVVAVVGLLFTSSVASAQVCALGIIVKALYANATENRELTAREAATCGILTDDKEVAEMKKAKEKAAGKKVAHTARKKNEPKKN